MTLTTDRLSIQVLSGGRSNLTLLVEAGPQVWILRRPPRGHRPGSPTLLHREVRVLRALEGTALPVPRVVASWPDDRIVGASGYIMSCLPGITLEEHLQAASTAPPAGLEMTDVAQVVIGALAEVNDVDWEEAGLAGLDRSPGGSSGGTSMATAACSTEWPSGCVPPPHARPSCRVHGDFRPGNLLSAAHPQDLCGILDWEISTIGDPLTDLGFLIAYWEPTGGRVAHPSQLLAPALGASGGPALAAMYATATGRDVQRIDWYVAEEHWKTAAVLKIIEARYHRGETLGDGFGGLAASISLHVRSAAASATMRASS